ncbi:MAG: hemerythrin family protein [bacterium]
MGEFPNYIIWNMSYSIGDDLLDSQHKKIFNIINDLYLEIKQGATKKELREIWERLVEYPKTHFPAEEKIMKASQFPDLIKHQSVHQGYLTKIDISLPQLFQKEGDYSLDFLEFLKDWWKGHVMKLDLQIKPYILKMKKSGKDINLLDKESNYA